MTIFTYTGSVQSYVVPANATVVFIKCYGGGYDDPSKGGEGGYAEGRLAVTGGETLVIRCGGVGVLFGSNSPFNGGAYSDGYPGCGASDVRQGGTALSNRKIVAAGGGGTAYATDGTAWDRGGDGGADVGEDSGIFDRDGKGGTQSAGGAAGDGGAAGTLGNGGAGSFDLNSSGGGGGGGRYGGGGGDGLGGGGGGSNWIGGVTSGVSNRGGWTGPGRVEITVVETSPNKPVWATPANDTLFDRTADFSVGYLFSDDTPGDSQSARDIRYKAAGAGSWDATVSATTGDTDYTIPGGTFSAGRKEIQVRVYDQVGNVSPWSDSRFLNAADPTPAPVFTSPSAGATVDTPLAATWTAAAQSLYRERRVADDGGDADESIVYWTGPVVTSAVRGGVFTFDVNNRDEHLQVQVKDDELWSEWGDVLVTVEFAPTSVPVVELEADEDAASIDVSWTNPAATGGEVEAVSNQVWVKDYDVWERFATGLPLNSTWRYGFPRSGVDYDDRIKVVAVGTNGGTAEGFPS